MSRRSAGIHLTPALIERRHGGEVVDDPAVMRELPHSTITASLRDTLACAPSRDELWLFVYGSLLWDPDVRLVDRRLAIVHGYHRQFCLWQWRHRGSPGRPCLMLALDRGGACRGAAYRITGPGLEQRLAGIWRREMRGDGYRPRWITAYTASGPVPAVTFVANRDGRRYAGRLSPDLVADQIASGCGQKGACAEYLRRLVVSLDRLGVHDGRLWELQRLVAARLAAADVR